MQMWEREESPTKKSRQMNSEFFVLVVSDIRSNITFGKITFPVLLSH